MNIQYVPVTNCTGGVFLLRKNNIILNDTKVKNWNSVRGIKIQKARYNRLVLRPITNWCNNRGIVNRQIIESLLFLKAHGKFDEITIQLDAGMDYSTKAIKEVILSNLR